MLRFELVGKCWRPPQLFTRDSPLHDREGRQNAAEFHAEDTYDSFDGKTSATQTDQARCRRSGEPCRPRKRAGLHQKSIADYRSEACATKEMRERYLQNRQVRHRIFKSVSVTGPSFDRAEPATEIASPRYALHGVTKG